MIIKRIAAIVLISLLAADQLSAQIKGTIIDRKQRPAKGLKV